MQDPLKSREDENAFRTNFKKLFSWKAIGSWENASTESKEASLQNVHLIENYIVNHFYSDWYWNCSLIIGTCFFAWLIGRIGGGIFALGFVLLFTNSVYRAEFRRFNRDLKDDMTRIQANNRLENDLETMEWLNSFLDKFWIIYMPALSEQVMFQANEVLKDQAPGFGIEKLSLDEFTLGSKAPRIESIKTYPKDGEVVTMDWNFAFAPNDTDDMTKNEIKKKINPKVALGITVGKAFVSKSLPVLVENMSFKGRMNIKLKLSHNFPHVKIVSIQFLEPPAIDYVLKPVGGDTFGLDIMSLIPGLSSFVNGLIHSNLRPMLYAPNSLDVDVEEILAQQSNDANSVLSITIKRCIDLKNPDKTKPLNPYVELRVENNSDIKERTKVKKSIDRPIFMENKLLLLNNLEGNYLNLNVYNLVEDKPDDISLGTTRVDLAELLQEDCAKGVVKSIVKEKRVMGKIEYDIKYHPILIPETLEDGTKLQTAESRAGILKFILHEAKNLDISKSAFGALNPCADIFLDGVLVKTCRVLRQINEPSWDQSFEALIPHLPTAQVEVVVRDAVENNVVGRTVVNLLEILFECSRGQEWFNGISPVKEIANSKFRMSAKFKPLAISDDEMNVFADAPVGGLRLHVRNARNVKNLEAFGSVDPYLRILTHETVISKSNVFSKNLNPDFNHLCFIPVDNVNDHVLIEIMDEEEESHDRSLGTCGIHVKDFVKRDANGRLIPYDGAHEVLKQDIIYNGSHEGVLEYSVSFIPTLPVLSLVQRQNKEKYEKAIEEEKLREEKKRQEEEELYKKHPEQYEWIDTYSEETVVLKKSEIPLDQLVTYNAGIATVRILEGKFSTPDVLVHVLFDESPFPCGKTSRSEGNDLKVSSSTEGFIRDLPYSQVIFRVTKKFEVNVEKDILCEKSVDTLDLLKRSYENPIDLKIDEKNSIKVLLDFTPSDVQLSPLDTVLGVGILSLDVESAKGLMAADTNGKADPFAVVTVDGVEAFKTNKIRKTLHPNWKESTNVPILSRSTLTVKLDVYDWDLTHERELIGSTELDLTSLDPLIKTPLNLPLDPQGEIHLIALFTPKYIRPKLSSKKGIPVDFGSLKDAPGRAVGEASSMAQGAVGAGFLTASDGVFKGSHALKGLMRHKKKGSSDEHINEESDLDTKVSRLNVSTSKKGRVVSSPANGQDEDISVRTVQDAPLVPNGENSSRNGNNHVFTPPPGKQSFADSRAADLSSIASSYKGTDYIAGRLTIKSFDLKSKTHLEVKAYLLTADKERLIYKTRSAKFEGSSFSWNETTPFKAPLSGSLQFSLKEHHRIGKNKTLATYKLDLETVLNKPDDYTLDGPNGKLTVNVRFSGPPTN